MDRMPEESGCMSKGQLKALSRAIKEARNDPRLLCDLEGSGPVASLEASFSGVSGLSHNLAVSSGTAAIYTALAASGAGPGDEVILPAYSWRETLSPVLACGASPVFADISPGSLTLEPEQVERCLSSRTRAVIFVPLFGNPSGLEKISSITRVAGIRLIIDAAHATSARLYNRYIGEFADITCFSLGRGKLICAGEGGMVSTSDPEMYEAAVAFSQHPERMRRQNGNVEICREPGLNFRMHPLAAVLARAAMEDAPVRLEHRRSVLDAFRCGLGQTDRLALPAADSETAAEPYGIPLIYLAPSGRRELAEELSSKGYPLRCGPLKTPLAYCLKSALPTPDPNGTDLANMPARSAAAVHCEKRELWALSALDMDSVSPSWTEEYGQTIRRSLSA